MATSRISPLSLFSTVSVSRGRRDGPQRQDRSELCPQAHQRQIRSGVVRKPYLEATRRSFNKDFLLALAADFKKHGAAAIEKVRKQQPAAYMKICALLVPREMQVEHSGGRSSARSSLSRGCWPSAMQPGKSR